MANEHVKRVVANIKLIEQEQKDFEAMKVEAAQGVVEEEAKENPGNEEGFAPEQTQQKEVEQGLKKMQTNFDQIDKILHDLL